MLNVSDGIDLDGRAGKPRYDCVTVYGGAEAALWNETWAMQQSVE